MVLPAVLTRAEALFKRAESGGDDPCELQEAISCYEIIGWEFDLLFAPLHRSSSTPRFPLELASECRLRSRADTAAVGRCHGAAPCRGFLIIT